MGPTQSNGQQDEIYVLSLNQEMAVLEYQEVRLYSKGYEKLQFQSLREQNRIEDFLPSHLIPNFGLPLRPRPVQGGEKRVCLIRSGLCAPQLRSLSDCDSMRNQLWPARQTHNIDSLRSSSIPY
jgi:hypothetical protein